MVLLQLNRVFLIWFTGQHPFRDNTGIHDVMRRVYLSRSSLIQDTNSSVGTCLTRVLTSSSLAEAAFIRCSSIFFWMLSRMYSLQLTSTCFIFFFNSLGILTVITFI